MGHPADQRESDPREAHDRIFSLALTGRYSQLTGFHT